MNESINYYYYFLACILSILWPLYILFPTWHVVFGQRQEVKEPNKNPCKDEEKYAVC